MKQTFKEFTSYQAQTSPHPMGIEVAYASGSYIYDSQNKAYLDFVAGVAACPLGHTHPKVINAICQQAQQYIHTMVYGEFIQKPALELCKLLAQHLPTPLQTTYLVNSGTEAVEGALKLAKRHTKRHKIIAAKNAYHGNTQGSMSVLGNENHKQAFRPLLPYIHFIEFNNTNHLQKIDVSTAAVILETIQGSAGFICPEKEYLQQVSQKCKEVGALLILDEIQSGFGRTGTLFAFNHYNIVPDILVMGKAMAGGMPIGAFTSSKEIMNCLSNNPKLGHITTFGGNPVIAAAAKATLDELLATDLIAETLKKEAYIRKLLQHPKIQNINGKGLMLSVVLETTAQVNYVILEGLKKGIILFWLLYQPKAIRISPPLTISYDEINKACQIILSLLDEFRPLH